MHFQRLSESFFRRNCSSATEWYTSRVDREMVIADYIGAAEANGCFEQEEEVSADCWNRIPQNQRPKYELGGLDTAGHVVVDVSRWVAVLVQDGRGEK